MTANAYDSGMAVAAFLQNQTVARVKAPLVSTRRTGIVQIDKADDASVDGLGTAAAIVVSKTDDKQFHVTSRGDSKTVEGVGSAAEMAELLATSVSTPRMLVVDNDATFSKLIQAAHNLEPEHKSVFRMWDRQRNLPASLYQSVVALARLHFVSPDMGKCTNAVAWANALGVATDDRNEATHAVLDAVESLGSASKWLGVVAAECAKIGLEDLRCSYPNALWASSGDDLIQFVLSDALWGGFETNRVTDPIWANRCTHDGTVIRGAVTQSDKNEDWFAIAITTQLRLKAGKDVQIAGHIATDKSGRDSTPNFVIREIEATQDGLTIHIKQHRDKFRRLAIDGAIIDVYAKPDNTQNNVRSAKTHEWSLRRESWITNPKRSAPKIQGKVPIYISAAAA